MSLARTIAVSLVALSACSGSRVASRPEEPWNQAYSGASDGWWRTWHESLHGKQPFGPGTQFELESVGPHGERSTTLIEVLSITPNATGSFSVILRSTRDSSVFTYKVTMPGDLAYTPGPIGSITSRNEKLVSVTVPAGTFAAGRIWRREERDETTYERDEWLVPDIPIPVQSWSRPASATELYNPPADGAVPDGTTLTRLVRIEKK